MLADKERVVKHTASGLELLTPRSSLAFLSFLLTPVGSRGGSPHNTDKTTRTDRWEVLLEDDHTKDTEVEH